jgi:hypothetical protein
VRLGEVDSLKALVATSQDFSNAANAVAESTAETYEVPSPTLCPLPLCLLPIRIVAHFGSLISISGKNEKAQTDDATLPASSEGLDCAPCQCPLAAHQCSRISLSSPLSTTFFFFFFLWKCHPDVIPGIAALDRQVVAPARKFGDPAAILIFGPPFEGGHASETSFHSQGMDEHFQEFRGIAQSWR